MTRERAIEILRRVWGEKRTMTTAEYAEIAAEKDVGEPEIEALHRIAGIPRPKHIAPYSDAAFAWYRNLSQKS